MRERLVIIASVAIVLALLALLNAASYVRVEREPDSEIKPDRSTANAGATGTRAFYEFLLASGYKAMRWRELPSELLANGATKPTTFVVVGELRRQFDEQETKSVLRWVQQGGHLVLIDRSPDAGLLPRAEYWQVIPEMVLYVDRDARPDDAGSMTAGMPPHTPAQPTLLTRDVERIAPSRFATRLNIIESKPDERVDVHGTSEGERGRARSTATPRVEAEEVSDYEEYGDLPPAPSDSGPVVVVADGSPPPEPAPTPSGAPVVHLADAREKGGALLVDYRHGKGRITVLSDPYIVSNGGISRADNLQLAVNIVTAAPGIIAFDEYHHGRAATQNQLFAYFAGTPVMAMSAQLAVIILAVLWTRGRRFARPLPAPRVDRRSKLEFVASMAELQQRARAYDLAIENIYTRTRRALARYAGLSSAAPREEIAARVAARSGRAKAEIEELMRRCEDAMAGEPLAGHDALKLTANLRQLERELGIRMRARETRQAGTF